MSAELKKEIAAEVTAQVLQSIKKEVIPAVKDSIEVHVNGGIRRIDAKLDAHIEMMKPVYEVYDTTNRMGNFIVWISKVFLAVGAIVGSIIGVTKLLK